jgi:hypothetical protein
MTPPAATSRRCFTVPSLAEEWGVDRRRIDEFIKLGLLRAFDIGPGRGKQRRWRITPEAVAEFEAARSSGPPAPKISRQRRKKDPAVIEFF